MNRIYKQKDHDAMQLILDAYPQVFINLIDAVEEVVSDFENYGEVLQTNDCGEYDETTAIMKLSRSLHDLQLLLD